MGWAGAGRADGIRQRHATAPGRPGQPKRSPGRAALQQPGGQLRVGTARPAPHCAAQRGAAQRCTCGQDALSSPRGVQLILEIVQGGPAAPRRFPRALGYHLNTHGALLLPLCMQWGGSTGAHRGTQRGAACCRRGGESGAHKVLPLLPLSHRTGRTKQEARGDSDGSRGRSGHSAGQVSIRQYTAEPLHCFVQPLSSGMPLL